MNSTCNATVPTNHQMSNFEYRYLDSEANKKTLTGKKIGVVHYWIRTVNGDKGFGGRVNHE